MSIFKNILAKIFPSDRESDQSRSGTTGQVPQAGAAGGAGQTTAASTTGTAPATGTTGMAGAAERAGAPGTVGSAAEKGMAAGARGMPTETGSTSSPGQHTATSTPRTATSQPVDVEAVLTEMQSRNPETLNWRTSIVDLLKLLGLDSSLTSRKELATELGYTGSMDDSASMNIWLHKEVMRRFAENGGRVPSDLH